MSYPQTIFFSNSLQNDISYKSYQKDYKIQNNKFLKSKRGIDKGHLVSTFKKEFAKFIRAESIMQPIYMYKNDMITQNKINDFIIGYVFRDLDKAQIEKIIMSYGLTQSFELFHDFHVTKHFCNCSDFCNYLINPDIKLNNCLVELILFQSIGLLKNKPW